MKYSILAVVLGFLIFQSVSVAADDDFEDGNITKYWEDFDVLDELVSEDDLSSLDNSTLYDLDADLAECEYEADNHGHFVKCCKKALKNYKDLMPLEEFKALKKSIAKSDLGKSAVELIVDDTGVDFNKNEAKLLDDCENKAKSLKGYKKCLSKVLNNLVQKGGLKLKEAKKIKKAVEDNDEIESEIEEEIEKEDD